MTRLLAVEPGSGLTSRVGRRRRLAALGGAGATLVAVGMLAAACGSTASPTTSTSSSSSSSSTAAAASGSSVEVKTAKIASLGTVLVDSKGMTLYHYTLDHAPTIACTGSCASIWPPLLVPSGSHVMGPKGVGTLKRPDGTTQVTYQGLPLYTYVGDKSPGQAAGEGYTHNWYVLKVGASSAGGGSTTSSSTSSSGGGY